MKMFFLFLKRRIIALAVLQLWGIKARFLNSAIHIIYDF